ncbi:antitoxin MazE [Scopulibacillus darangshiensis]|uniref:Antitoxin MazE n=1 Tax=Scopulibacillus darangshiensis TaxID=442528 RepID=A0A4R2NAK1_9BACL|nr:AbrB/MazE/SpoVT family DNA-binding domain-containing protein [Scopulibacillus darangshiensis]TCP18034.1 antitoxin MazE [Scopulibacillus darangshiensis]
MTSKDKGVLKVTTTVQKWGNSLGIRIPSSVVKEIAIHQGSEMEVMVENQGITLKPKRKKPTLEELLSQCKPENRHEEIDFGRAGRELF